MELVVHSCGVSPELEELVNHFLASSYASKMQGCVRVVIFRFGQVSGDGDGEEFRESTLYDNKLYLCRPSLILLFAIQLNFRLD